MSSAGSAPRPLFPLTLTAIGVVYGDIGTSPLYAMRECFFGSHSVPPTVENVLGVLSLIIYSLLLVISVKYIAIVMRADNQGEGGILALTALLPNREGNTPRWPVLVLMGIFGAALLYGDGMITPAITVLGAVEGLKVATPLFEPYVVPVTVGHPDRRLLDSEDGTHRVGNLFGPIMVIWFVVIAALGVMWLVQQPVVLTAVDPRHAVRFFQEHALARLRGARRGVPRRHRRRGAVRGHGPLRQAADPDRLVRPRAPRAAPQLLRPGRAAASPMPRPSSSPSSCWRRSGRSSRSSRWRRPRRSSRHRRSSPARSR